MRKFMVIMLAIHIAFTSSWGLAKTGQSLSGESQQAIASIDYLLSIDRLHFYTQNLADFLDGKKSPEVIKALRDVTPEDIYHLKLDPAVLSNSSLWQQTVYDLLKQKTPSLPVTMSDLEWNYNFFKNKLMERFSVKGAKAAKESSLVKAQGEDLPVMRSVPKISGNKYLLDVERYIAEKTTRAIIWDAILNDRDFDFHIGTQRDFQNTIERNGIEIVTEIKPMANNYNKIFLTHNPKTGRYAYVMNLISGDDRIKHLIAQLRLIKFDGKGYLVNNRDKIHVFGNALEFHKRQEAALLDIYNRLPKADKVIIGQKGAIDDAIRNAGMMDIIKDNMPEVMKGIGVTGSKASKFENLAVSAAKDSTFLLDGMNNSPVKIDKAYEQIADTVSRSYRQFNSEQPSHEFSDYLLQAKDGSIKRWRVISAVWGDEIVPIAGALKKSGHKDIVYIGTAGAIDGKGIKVGDVIAGTNVQTHSGKTLKFSEGTLSPTAQARAYTVGQVHTPFDETDTWLKKQGPAMDIVEVETGYLREQLGLSLIHI